MATRRSSRVNPYEPSAVGFTCTRTAGFWPPLILTRPTPGSCEIFCARRVSARSCTFTRGSVFEVRARVRIGAAAGVGLLEIGGGGGAAGGDTGGGGVVA